MAASAPAPCLAIRSFRVWWGRSRFAPNPKEVGEQVEANGEAHREDRSQNVVYAAGTKNIRRGPPDAKARRIGDVILPQAYPGGTRMFEHPTINHEEAEKRTYLARKECG